MRNHYDLGRRTDRSKPPAPEPDAEAVGLKRRRFPLWITVFISSLLLGTGTAVYAVTAFNSSPSRPDGDTVLTSTANGSTLEEGAGFDDGFTHGEGEKADTPPVWEDSPTDPNPISRESDKPSDTQKPKRQQDSTTQNQDDLSSNRTTANRENGRGRNNILFNRPPSLLGAIGAKGKNREPTSTPSAPKDSTNDPPSYDDGDSENPAPTPQNIRVAVGYPFWMASQVGNSSAKDALSDEVNLFGYEFQPDGSVNSMTEAGEKEDVKAVRSARQAGVRVVPIVTSGFVPDRLHDLLASPQKRARAADSLVKWAVDRNFDGIDILFDPIDKSGRENLTLFIEELAEKLRKEGKRLSIYVHPKMTESSKEWKRWGQAVDQLKIIHPGGIRPDPEEARKQIDQLLTLVKSREKVHLVLLLHGDLGPSGEDPFSSQDPNSRNKQKDDIQRDPRDEADITDDRTTVDDDPKIKHYQTMIQYVLENHSDIGGIHLWFLGGAEDPEIREVIQHLKERAQRERD